MVLILCSTNYGAILYHYLLCKPQQNSSLVANSMLHVLLPTLYTCVIKHQNEDKTQGENLNILDVWLHESNSNSTSTYSKHIFNQLYCFHHVWCCNYLVNCHSRYFSLDCHPKHITLAHPNTFKEGTKFIVHAKKGQVPLLSCTPTDFSIIHCSRYMFVGNEVC